MSKRMFLNGNEAVAHGVKLCKPGVIAAYPITPQTMVVEKLSTFVANGEIDAEYMYVESEHSAMTSVMGASLAGARTFTATSSQGLVHMCEMLHYVSGSRFPIVMMNANRTLAAPWNIFGDQRDSVSQRDSGWIQVYVENPQEALDMTIQAFKIAEDERVYTPVMVNLDGYVNTHTFEVVMLPDQQEVDEFLPAFVSLNTLDFDDPHSFCISANTAWNTEIRFQQHEAMFNAVEVIEKVDNEYAERFGRSYGGMVKEYLVDDADVVLVAMGSVTGTIQMMVDQLRSEGVRAGLVKLRFLRPFPVEYFNNLATRVKGVGIIDRNISFGYEGAVASEVKAAMYTSGSYVPVINFVCGLAGRDITHQNIRDMFEVVKKCAAGEKYEALKFSDLRWNE